MKKIVIEIIPGEKLKGDLLLSWCLQEDSDSLVFFSVASRLLPGGILPRYVTLPPAWCV